jgi:hypothetical protein
VIAAALSLPAYARRLCGPSIMTAVSLINLLRVLAFNFMEYSGANALLGLLTVLRLLLVYRGQDGVSGSNAT